MTDEKVIQLAEEAGIDVEGPFIQGSTEELQAFAQLLRNEVLGELQAFAQLLRNEVLEEAAEYCRELINEYNSEDYCNAADWCANRIEGLKS